MKVFRIFAVVVLIALIGVLLYSRMPLRFDGSSSEAFDASAKAIQDSLEGDEKRQFENDIANVMALITTEDRELAGRVMSVAFSSDSQARADSEAELQALVRARLDGKTHAELRVLAEQGRKSKKEKFGGLFSKVGEGRPSPPRPPVQQMWANEAELLAAAPDTELVTQEIEIRDTAYLIDLPKDAIIDTDRYRGGIKLATGEHAAVFSRDWSIPRLRRLNGEFVYKGYDSIVFTDDTIIFKKLNEQKGHGDHPYDVKLNVVINKYRVIGFNIGHAIDGPLDDSPVTLEAALQLVRCLKTLRLKHPDPTKPTELLAALGVRFAPEDAVAPEAVLEIEFHAESAAPDFRILELFPNVESVTFHEFSPDGDVDTIAPLRQCKKLKRLIYPAGATVHNIDTIFHHKGLEELNTDLDSRHSAEWFGRFRSLKKLRRLTLEVDDEHVSQLIALAACTQLESLAIDADGYESLADNLDFVTRLPKLTELTVKGNFTDSLFATLGRKKNLTSLTLELEKMTGTSLKRLSDLRSLKYLKLDVDEAKFGTDDFKALAGIPLESIVIKSDPDDGELSIDDTNVMSLGAVKSLKFLQLDVERVGLAGLGFLKLLPKLTDVRLDTSDALTYDDIDKLRSDNPKLTIESGS